MREITYPFELTPSAYGTKLTFTGEEDGEWSVELNVHVQNESSQKRVKLIFGGVTQARVNDDLDRKTSGKYALMQIGDSTWVKSFLDSYIQEFGTALLPVVKNMRHFVIRGQEASIGFLARRVECVVVD